MSDVVHICFFPSFFKFNFYFIVDLQCVSFRCTVTHIHLSRRTAGIVVSCKIPILATQVQLPGGTGHVLPSLVVPMVKKLPAMQETRVQPLDWEDPLEKGMATHSGILVSEIPWTEERGGLQSTGSQKSQTQRID